MKVIGCSSKTAFFLKKIHCDSPYWRLLYKTKCESTEIELTKFLKYSKIKINHPIAIVAREQSAGFGQNSSVWHAPTGGIWLSAAYPIFSESFSSEIIGLSFAVKLCEMCWQDNIKVDLKWPNDIFFNSKKLIGFLPKVITRGNKIIYVRIGIGMNILNKTPLEGISLAEVLKTRNISKYYWTAKILKAFQDSVAFNDDKERVIKAANKFLTKTFLPRGYSANEWKIKDIDSDGGLRIYNQTQEKTITRF